MPSQQGTSLTLYSICPFPSQCTETSLLNTSLFHTYSLFWHVLLDTLVFTRFLILLSSFLVFNCHQNICLFFVCVFFFFYFSINNVLRFLTVKIGIFSGDKREGRRKMYLSNKVHFYVGFAVLVNNLEKKKKQNIFILFWHIT